MAVKLTDDQLNTLKSMMDVAGKFSDQLLHIMRNSGIDRIPGCHITIQISPELKFMTEELCFGYQKTDAGFVRLGKGKYDETFRPTGDSNSAEYELLFADEAVRERMAKILNKEKPVCPDGIWIGDDRNNPPLDCYGREIRFDDLPVRGAINQ